MAKSETPRIQGKRHIARARQEAETQRRILLGLGGVVALILLVLAIGLLRIYVIVPRQPVARVNGVEISTTDYRKRLLYEGFLIDQQIDQLQVQLEQISQSFPDNPQFQQSLSQQVQQQGAQLLSQRADLERTVLDDLIEEELVIQEAAARGIEVTNDEVTEAYNSEAASRQGGFTESETSATVTARLVAADNATATAAEFTPTPTLTTTVETTGAVSPTATAAPTPTINTITGDSLTEAVTTYEQEAQDAAGLTLDELHEIVRRRLLKDKMAEVIGDEAETTALQTNARHILVRTAETDDEETVQTRLELAEEIRGKWINGESYDDLKAEYEADPEGNVVAQDLGWFTEDAMVAEFAEAAFSQEVGTISEPVKTQFGWHLIDVLEREERPLEGFALDQARSEAYNNWLIQARSGDIENLWTPDSPPPNFGS